MYYPDFNEIRKWTGVMALKNFEMIRDDMDKKHLLDLEPQYVQASGRFATLLYKEEIEVLLRTQGYAGFSLLDLHDYPTQGTALVGPLDAFWDSKGFITPEAFHRYCGPTVPLLRMPKRTYAGDEPFEATADLAHYGAADLVSAKPAWNIKDDQGREIAAGTLPEQNIATGKLTELGAIKASLAGIRAPGKFTVTVCLKDTDFSNAWEIWVYPAVGVPKPPADVVVCEKWDNAKAALASGKKVVLFALSENAVKSMRGRFLPVFWSPVWFPSQKPNTMGLLCDPKHPIFAQFPTEFHSNWQWFDLMQRSRMFILDEAPAAYRPTLQVIDNFERNHKFGLIFEGRVGNGRLLVCGLDLLYQTKEPAARQLLASLYHYTGTTAFNPADELPAELLDRVFEKPASALARNGAKVINADSEATGYPAINVIDGNPSTIWHTKWKPAADPMPHQVVIDMGKELTLKGMTYLPRGDQDQGRVAQCAVYCGNDPVKWGEPVASAKFHKGDSLQTVDFKTPIKGRYLKFVIQSEIKNNPFASVAELDVVEAKP